MQQKISYEMYFNIGRLKYRKKYDIPKYRRSLAVASWSLLEGCHVHAVSATYIP